jgi:NitT/TauT family transport system ATP-binding protein
MCFRSKGPPRGFTATSDGGLVIARRRLKGEDAADSGASSTNHGQPAPVTGEKSRSGALVFEGISKTYDAHGYRVHAIKDVSFAIEPSQAISIVGPSGCGKSTLLKIAGGLVPADGHVFIHGRPISGPSREIGFMLQSPLLFPWRTVQDNVLLPARVHRTLSPAARERAMSLLAMVGLGDFAQHYPFQLSGGMQQRAALCRVLFEDPEILLLDEPFGALDEFTREKLNLRLLDIHEQTGKTIVLVTHNIIESVLLSDRVIVMSDRPGEILGDVTIDLPRPRKLDVMKEQRFTEYVFAIRGLLGIESDE